MHFWVDLLLIDEVEKKTVYNVLAGCLQHDWTLSETVPTPKLLRAGPRCSGREPFTSPTVLGSKGYPQAYGTNLAQIAIWLEFHIFTGVV